MPILIMALMALGVFIGIGLMLFSATFAEARTRDKMAAAKIPQEPEQKPKAKAAHA